MPASDGSTSAILDTAAPAPADDSVKVAVRIRPFNPQSDGDGNTEHVVKPTTDGRTVEVDESVTDVNTRQKLFSVDHVFNGGQQEVYEAIGQPLLQEAVQGYNVCIFAYGQTGSGKTYSTLGPQDDLDGENAGLVCRMFKDLMRTCEETTSNTPTLTCKVTLSICEVYKEKVYDLLAQHDVTKPGQQLPSLRVTPAGKKKKSGWEVPDLTTNTVYNTNMVVNLLKQGLKHRKQNATSMNPDSSRSHSITTFKLHQVYDPPNPMQRDRESKITIVDLAGSERTDKAACTDLKLQKETEFINMSLLTLSKCLRQTVDPTFNHVSVRESVLTKLISDIFGGNAKVAMLATISPSKKNICETLATLQYAMTAKQIKQHAEVNVSARRLEMQEMHTKMQAIELLLQDVIRERDTQRAAFLRTIAEKDDEIASLKANPIISTPPPPTPPTDPTPTPTPTPPEEALLESEGGSTLSSGSSTPREGSYAKAKVGKAPKVGLPRNGSGGVLQGEKGLQQSQSFLLLKKAETERISWDHRNSTSQLANMSSLDLAALRKELTARGLPMPTECEDIDDEDTLDTTRTLTAAEQNQRKQKGIPQLPLKSTVLAQLKTNYTVVRNFGASYESVRRGAHISDTASVRSVARVAVYGCALTSDGVQVATCGRDNYLRLYNTASSEEEWKVSGPKGAKLLCVDISKDAGLVIAGSSDFSCLIVSLEGKVLKTLKKHTNFVHGCRFTRKGSEFGTASCDGTVKVWKAVAPFDKISSFKGHTKSVMALDFSPDGVHAVSGGEDATLSVWDYRSGATVAVSEGCEEGCVWALRFHPSGRVVASGAKCGNVKLWSFTADKAAPSLQCTRTFTNSSGVQAVCFASSNTLLCTVDSRVKVFKLPTFKHVGSFGEHTGAVHCISPLQGAAALTCASDGSVKLWKL